MTAAGSPHSETLGSKPARRLPEAYRCPPRLSSVPSAKASTIRPCRQPHTRGNPQDQTNTGRQIINTLRSQNDQTNNQTPKTGTRSKYISTSRPRPATPKKGGHAVRSRPLSSSQTTTPHHTPPPGHNQTGTHGGHPNANPPTRRAVAAREPNSMPIPAPTGAQRSFHASTPDTPGNKPREPCQALKTFSVERR